MQINSFIREHVIKRFTRSPKWSKVRKAYLKKHNKCRVCGGKKKLEVHHIEDFSTRPELELKPSNFITLCRKRRCHLLFGHLNYWKSINPNVKEDAKVWQKKIKKRRKLNKKKTKKKVRK